MMDYDNKEIAEALTALAALCEKAEQAAFDKGFNQGFEAGRQRDPDKLREAELVAWARGCKAGREGTQQEAITWVTKVMERLLQRGYNTGFDAGTRALETVRQQGWDAGWAAARDECVQPEAHSKIWDEGWDDGYDQGQKAEAAARREVWDHGWDHGFDAGLEYARRIRGVACGQGSD